MKKAGLILAIFLIAFTGCKKVTPIPEIMTFTIDGVTKDFSNGIEMRENGDEIIITAYNGNYEFIEVRLPEKKVAVYTEEDYNFTSSDIPRPNITYGDSKGNKWEYFGPITDRSDLGFDLDVRRYNDREVSGAFSGSLWAYDTNGPLVKTSIVITNGVFSHEIKYTANSESY